MKKGLLFFLSLGLFVIACQKDDDGVDQAVEDQEIILQYLTDNNLTATEHESGIHYIITEEGTGTEHPSATAAVEVKYKGYFVDDSVFDQTTGSNTITFALNGVIEGWQIAIPLLKKSGKGTFLIPSALAYGPSGRGSIPPNTVLIFDVELIDF